MNPVICSVSRRDPYCGEVKCGRGESGGCGCFTGRLFLQQRVACTFGGSAPDLLLFVVVHLSCCTEGICQIERVQYYSFVPLQFSRQIDSEHLISTTSNTEIFLSSVLPAPVMPVPLACPKSHTVTLSKEVPPHKGVMLLALFLSSFFASCNKLSFPYT